MYLKNNGFLYIFQEEANLARILELNADLQNLWKFQLNIFSVSTYRSLLFLNVSVVPCEAVIETQEAVIETQDLICNNE